MTRAFHLPVVLAGACFEALVVGAGRVAARRVHTLLEAGVNVRVLAPTVAPDLTELAARDDRLTITRAVYVSSEIGSAHLVVAATDDASLNARIAEDARSLRRLVNVVDAPELGNFVIPAVHRSHDLVIAVSAGGLPRVASTLRDRIAARFDDRYGAALRQLSQMRRRLLDAGDRKRWQSASEALVGEDFCEVIERGDFAERMRAWR